MPVEFSNPYSNVNGIAAGVNKDGLLANKKASDKEDFLNLLVTQLKNQDPLNPTDQKEMLAQLAQFSTIEQVQNLNQTMTASLAFNQMAQGASLIGKTITTSGATPEDVISGVVKSVNIHDGKTYLDIDGKEVEASRVVQIK